MTKALTVAMLLTATVTAANADPITLPGGQIGPTPPVTYPGGNIPPGLRFRSILGGRCSRLARCIATCVRLVDDHSAPCCP